MTFAVKNIFICKRSAKLIRRHSSTISSDCVVNMQFRKELVNKTWIILSV